MITRCGSEEFCNSFSFRFSNYNDQDNCLLSGLNTSNILPNSDLVPDSEWDIWQFRCKDSSSRDWVLRLEASKMSSLVVDATSAVSGLSSCARRCQDMAGCLVFAFSSQGYTNCQVTRLQYSHLGRTDILQDRQWDLFELRTTGGGGGGGGLPKRVFRGVPGEALGANPRGGGPERVWGGRSGEALGAQM